MTILRHTGKEIVFCDPAGQAEHRFEHRVEIHCAAGKCVLSTQGARHQGLSIRTELEPS